MNAEPLAPAFRTLPHNVEAEKAVLGTLMAFPETWERVAFLRPEYFALRQNGVIFAKMRAIVDAGKPANPVTLSGAFDGELQEVGGPAYLAELATSAVGPINAEEYAHIISDCYRKRELVAIGEELTDRAYSGDVLTDPRSLADEAERRFTDLTITAEETKPETLKFIEARYQSPGSLIGVSSGYADLDKILCGFQVPDLILLAGRPSMGKSTLAGAIAWKCGEPCALLELEQSALQTEMRIIADMAGVPLDSIRHGLFSPQQRDAIIDADRRLRSLPLHILDMSAPTAETVRAKLRHLKRKHGIRLAIIDQLTHITPPDGISNPVQQIGLVLKVLKATAKDLGLPLIVLHQLNRALEARDDKRPTLADLRDSGHLEQDADVAMFIYRAEYYLERSEPPIPNPVDYPDDDTGFRKARKKRTDWERDYDAARNIAEIIIAK